MNVILNILITAATILITTFGVVKYAPLEWLGFNVEPQFGATITELQSTDQLSDFPTLYNANLNALNNNKMEMSTTSVDSIVTLNNLTTAGSLSTVGTITSGTWNADAITVPYGGTGSTTLSVNQVLLGNGTNGLKVIGWGESGQFLTSNGAGAAPSWTTSSIDTALDYDWTGDHTWTGNATSSIFGVYNTLYIGTTATSTLQGSTSGTSQLQGYLNILGANGTSTISSNLVVNDTASTTNLVVSGDCDNCATNGYEIVSDTNTNAVGHESSREMSVDCPAGKKVIGGGFYTSAYSDTSGDALEVYRSYPADSNTWKVVWYCRSASDCDLTTTIYAICVND